ncbi:Fic family protein [Rathayibacter tanaceti]|uniref:Adenosine monophosphate-protein transferase SoFic n=2 Tax=Rathayibacter tanaceti TaxID=1671680 RepID=A0A162F759_9MICO|nr:Fic/DOC family N-terminal domain-containing protein [Rathayibacter tanaceti]KZX19963.1 Adenosine monophosphate-protein transferase SoFic [Rathayibacter tanaceti]QHC54308.1 Fic family protein [Rathayibacter tanaceti]TCO37988.1 Fic family protein [Rathayibacter tanaceti]
MPWTPNTPYNELPLLPPSADLETRAVLRATIAARAALAALEQASRSLPNPAVLVNSIQLLEAQASSEIENIVTTSDELFRFADDEDAAADPATREALRYRRALFEGFALVSKRSVTLRTSIEACSIIKQHEMTLRDRPGTFIGDPLTGEHAYTPPVGIGTITGLLSNWETFIHESEGLDPLIVMAAAHYQFDAIHPFEDGNGRTGRVMNMLILVEHGLLSSPILYLSRYIIRRKSEYYRLLLAVTSEGAWEQWLLFMLEGIRETSQWTLATIDTIGALRETVREEMRSALPGGANADLLEVLFEEPYCRIRTVMARCGVSRPTARSWLSAMVERGILTDTPIGRERLFVNHAFLRLLKQDQETTAGPPAEPTLF